MNTENKPLDSASVAGTHRQIENLILLFCDLVDAGDFAAASALFNKATFITPGSSVHGGPAMEALMRKTLVVYGDGTPNTKHLITNLIVEADDTGASAAARSYVTVLQQTPEFPLQAIVTGTYHDKFALEDGKWHFTERRLFGILQGDLSAHFHRTV